MSATIILSLRAPVEQVIEAGSIVPDRLVELREREIARLVVWDGSERIEVGELFRVRGERSSTVRIEGDLAKVDGIGAGMAGGELVIEGDVGRYVGTRMRGGVVRVTGSAGYGAGLEMAGGVLDIAGDAGDRVGAARLGASKGMAGGEIIVRGRVGAEAGARMRRGTIVCRRAGACTGEGMIAGNLVVLGDVGEDAGRYNKRGSIVVLGDVAIPLTYRYACTYRPPHVALMLASLRARFGLPIAEAHIAGTYRRYSGDLAELGRGEILAWDGTR